SKQLVPLHEVQDDVCAHAFLDHKPSALCLDQSWDLREARYVPFRLGYVRHCDPHLDWEKVVWTEAPYMMGVVNDHPIIPIMWKGTPLHTWRGEDFLEHSPETCGGVFEVWMPYVNVEALKNTADAELDQFRLHCSSSSASASAQSMPFVSAGSMTASCFVSTVIVPISVPQAPHSRGICLSMV